MSATNWTLPATINEMLVDDIEVSGGFASFSYYESLFSPHITAYITFLDAGASVKAAPEQDVQERYGTLFSSKPDLETKDSKIEFEKNAIQYIHEFLDPTMDPIRIQLERVARVPKDNSRVSVQFLIMNGFRETNTPNEIIMNFKNRYGDGTTEFAEQYQLKKAVFGDPSIIIDGSENDKTNTFVQEKKEAEIVDTSTLKSIEEDPVNISYYGCNLTIADLTKNIISASTPLPYECNGTIEQFFKRP